MGKFIGLTEAAKVAGVSRPAMLNWVKKHEIGHMDGTRYLIDTEKLNAIIEARKLLRMRQPVGR